MSEVQLILLAVFGWAALCLNLVAAWRVKIVLEPHVGERVAKRVFVVLIVPFGLTAGAMLVYILVVLVALLTVLFLFYTIVVLFVAAICKIGEFASRTPPMAAA